jgi:RNA polymerase sigma-70 factor (ECF subfamily)
LREVDGMQYEEIAAALGCSVGTVESRLFRARKALTRKLKGLAREIGKEI